MNRTPIELVNPARGRRRLLGGAALLVFLGAFFAIPLWAALTLCTMPCCNPATGETPSAVVTAAMNGCQPECSIGAADAATQTATVVVPAPAKELGVSLTPPALSAVGVTVPASVVDLSAALPMTHGADAPIHVLNSTFRI